jgi:hypothetical protein
LFEKNEKIKELTKINKSLTYREIEKISDWDNYFENLKLDFCNVLKDLHVKNNLNGK